MDNYARQYGEGNEYLSQDFASKFPGMRKVGNVTIGGQRTAIYCTPTYEYCQTEWGQPYDWAEGADHSETLDFKTCQRADGTTYGTAGDCSQKGAREVSDDTGYGSGIRAAARKTATGTNSMEDFEKRVARLGPGAADRLQRDLSQFAKEYANEIGGLRGNSPDAKKAWERLGEDKVKDVKKRLAMLEKMRKSLKDHTVQFAETADFVTCQRADGSTYGTAGQCRLGVETTVTKPQGPQRKGYKSLPDMKMVMKASALDMEAATAKSEAARNRLEERARKIRQELANSMGFSEEQYMAFEEAAAEYFSFASKKEDLPCNKPKMEKHGDKKAVVKACGPGLPKDGKLIRFGDANMTTAGAPKKGESDKMKARRKSFKDRHRKNIARGPKSGAYWADKFLWSEEE